MENVTATFVIPNWITEGLKNQAYERVGGVIREVGSKKVVSWLREVSPSLIQSSTILSQFGSAASILNLGVSVIGFAIVIQRLEEIEQRLKILEKDVNQPGISIAALTVPLVLPVFTLGMILGAGALMGINSSEKEHKPQLLKPLQKIETMIETYRRFEAYQAEVEVISKLESSFQDWLQLTPSAEVKLDEVEFVYIIPSKPLDLQLCSYSIFEY